MTLPPPSPAPDGNPRLSGVKVILLGTDTPIGLAVIRDLGRHGCITIGIGRSRNALARYSRYCLTHVVRETQEQALISQIIELAARHGAAYLLAISEGDLLLLNRHRTELERSLHVLTPTDDLLDAVLDKRACQAAAEAVGLRVPRTLQVSSLGEAQAAAGKLAYPVVLKWSDPNAVADRLAAAGLELLKTEYAHDTAELLERLARYERVAAFPMIQEYCPGRGLGQMFLVCNGDVHLEFQHERLHEWPPEGGTSSLCRAVPLSRHGEARARSVALLKRLRWTGVAMVEYRYDRATGVYYFMEVNGRFWGSLPLAIAAGIPFAAGLVAVCGQGRPVPSHRSDYARLSCCYWIPETKRLLRVLFRRKRIRDPFFRADPLASLLSYALMPLDPSTRYFVFQFSDPLPFFADLGSVAAKAWSRLTARRPAAAPGSGDSLARP